MRYSLLTFTSVLLLGCGSTRVIEKTLDAAAVADVNEHCAATCKASVSYVENLELQASQDAESVYQRLVHKDLTITLRDSTVLQGRLRGFRPPDVWFVEEPGGERHQIPSFSIGQVRRSISAETIRLTDDKLITDGGRSTRSSTWKCSEPADVEGAAQVSAWASEFLPGASLAPSRVRCGVTLASSYRTLKTVRFSVQPCGVVWEV